jgi:hypothetical protein
MLDTHRIDKEAGLIKLTVGQICSAGIGHNIYTGDHQYYATPFMHTVSVWEATIDSVGYTKHQRKEVGLAIRIANDGTIISNPSFRGNAIIAFVPSGCGNIQIHTCKIIKVNKRSVNIEPLEYKGSSDV